MLPIRIFKYEDKLREVVVTESSDSFIKGIDCSHLTEAEKQTLFRIKKDINFDSTKDEAYNKQEAEKLKPFMKAFRHFKFQKIDYDPSIFEGRLMICDPSFLLPKEDAKDYDYNDYDCHYYSELLQKHHIQSIIYETGIGNVDYGVQKLDESVTNVVPTESGIQGIYLYEDIMQCKQISDTCFLRDPYFYTTIEDFKGKITVERDTENKDAYMLVLTGTFSGESSIVTIHPIKQ